MTSGECLYERVYQLLKSKIICGLYPGGSLPSRASLRKEYGVSEKTVRRALGMLAEDGLIETQQRKTARLSGARSLPEVPEPARISPEKIHLVSDIMNTAKLILPAFVGKGLALSTEAELDGLERIAAEMPVGEGTAREFWRAAQLFWRRVAARLENMFILRVVDHLTLFYFVPFPAECESRAAYRAFLLETVRLARLGRSPEELMRHFDLEEIRRNDQEALSALLDLLSVSPFLADPESLKRFMQEKECNNIKIYLRLLGQIRAGIYKKGEFLPTHEMLCREYRVSVNTTIRAVKELQRLGVVRSIRRKGIQILMDGEEFYRLPLNVPEIAGHIRQYLDELQMLELTARTVARNAAERAAGEEARAFSAMLCEGDQYGRDYGFAPVMEFLLRKIPYEPLRTIYSMILKSFTDNWGIANLFILTGADKEAMRGFCLACGEALRTGNAEAFGEGVFTYLEYLNKLIMRNCQKVGYWEAIQGAYRLAPPG